MKKLTTTKSLRTPIGFILSTVLLTLMIGVLASSCALDQGAGHTFSLRMPVLSTQDRSTSRAKATINESMIPYTVPPVVGWEDLLTESDTIDFSYLDKEVSCTYTINGGEVFFEGSSEGIDFEFTVTNGETYSYTIILLLDDTVLIETTSDGDIVQDYLEGEGVARIWKQNTEDDFSYIEYTTGLQSDGTPFFAITGRADLATDEEFNTPEAMTIDSWSEVRALFEEVAEDDLESVDEYFLQDNGNRVREDTADNG